MVKCRKLVKRHCLELFDRDFNIWADCAQEKVNESHLKSFSLYRRCAHDAKHDSKKKYLQNRAHCVYLRAFFGVTTIDDYDEVGH